MQASSSDVSVPGPSQELFERNFEHFSRILPEIALRLQDIDPSPVSFCKTRRGELNLSREVGGKTHYYHSNYSAEQEAKKWFAGLKQLDHTEVLYVYGVGLGHYLDAAKVWLDGDASRFLVFLEDDMAVLYRLLETEKGREILDHRQVQLHYFQDISQGKGMFEWLTWYFTQAQPDVSALEYYQRERADFTAKLRVHILHETVLKESIAGEYMRFGRSFYRNFFSNMLELPNSGHANRLFGRFEGVPAIICGAGPSLDKNFELLKTLTDRALIFSGGSSLNALSHRGLIPHFGAGIDPNPPQLERLMTNFGYEVPFFYRNRMYHQAFRAIHGPRLYLNGAGGYKVSEWFEDKLGIRDMCVDEGHNVINMSIDVARNLGCNPIILVGMDLAYTGMKSYAGGVLPNANVSEKDIVDSRDLESGAFLRKDVYGQNVYTLWKWVSEADWIGNYAKRHDDRVYINATEGGIGFPGVPHMPLQEVADQYLGRHFSLRDWVHGEIQNAALPEVTADAVLKCLREMYDSLDDCEMFCEGMIEEIEQTKQNIKKGKKVAPNLQTGKAAVYETELCESDAYQYVIGILGVIYQKVLERKCYQIKHDPRLRTQTERNLETLKVNREKTEFLMEAAAVNKELIEKAVEDFAGMGNDVSAFDPVKSEDAS